MALAISSAGADLESSLGPAVGAEVGASVGAFVGAVVGAVASAVLVGSDPVKNAKLRSMVSSRGSLATGAAIGAGLGLLISGAGFIHQQGGFS